MKKIHRSLLTVACLVLLGILAFSCQYFNSDDAKGTIGKVEKYRLDQMSEGDLLLRSDLIKDTAQLGNIIRGLAVQYAFNETFAVTLEKNAVSFQSSDVGVYLNKEAKAVLLFVEFLKNNNQELLKTINMLTEVYNDTVSENSFDIEQNLQNYLTYVTKMKSQDDVIQELVRKTDVWIAQSKKIMDQADIERIKQMRDEILVADFYNAIVMNDKKKLDVVTREKLYSVDALFSSDAVFSTDQIEAGFDLQVGADLNVASVIFANDVLGVVTVPAAMEEIANEIILQVNSDLQAAANGALDSYYDAISSVAALIILSGQGEVIGSVSEGIQAVETLCAEEVLGSIALGNMDFIKNNEVLSSNDVLSVYFGSSELLSSDGIIVGSAVLSNEAVSYAAICNSVIEAFDALNNFNDGLKVEPSMNIIEPY